MIIFKRAGDVQKLLSDLQKSGKKIGFVPTMGALHAGHISLVQSSLKETDFTVCSIFVNPTQFNDKKDLEKYPVTIEKDLLSLEQAGCHLLFYPPESEIYPNPSKKPLPYELGYLENILEGKYRPGHFQGVCQVMDRLLDIVRPDLLYLGQKDYQQCLVIKKLIQLKNGESDINVRISQTIREVDGLALSSRNLRLSGEERDKADSIFQTLVYIKNNLNTGDLRPLKETASSLLTNSGFRVDYIEIADAQNLEIIHDWDGKQNAVALIAAFLNEVRLIDNMILVS